MNKEGKNFKCFIGRADLVGDCILALPLLNYFEKLYPNSYKYWPILRKCSQAAPLFFNQKLIDKIVISDFGEGFGENDQKIFNSCDFKINVRPQHPFEQDWHNYRNVYEETWVMAGLPLKELYNLPKEEQLPRLEKWFNIDKQNKTIAIHGFAGYGKDKMRSPTEEYWKKLIIDLIKLGYKVIRFGHPNEPTFYFNDYEEIGGTDKFFDVRGLSLMEQVRMALGCSSYIGTDTGFSIILAAYDEIPQINLMCSWNVNHVKNPLCLAPIGDKCINLHSQIKCDDINPEIILENIKKFN